MDAGKKVEDILVDFRIHNQKVLKRTGIY